MDWKSIIELIRELGAMPADARQDLLTWADQQLDKREDKWIDGLKCHE